MVSIILESMVMVLDCPCLALEAQLIQNLLNKPLTKFGTPTQQHKRPNDTKTLDRPLAPKGSPGKAYKYLQRFFLVALSEHLSGYKDKDN